MFMAQALGRFRGLELGTVAGDASQLHQHGERFWRLAGSPQHTAHDDATRRDCRSHLERGTPLQLEQDVARLGRKQANKAQPQDPKMHQSDKPNQWRFVMQPQAQGRVGPLDMTTGRAGSFCSYDSCQSQRPQLLWSLAGWQPGGLTA